MTGGSGFVGSHLVDQLMKDGHEVHKSMHGSLLKVKINHCCVGDSCGQFFHWTKEKC